MEKMAGNPSIIKEVNENFIKDTIRVYPMITKPQLARQIGLSLATVNKVVERLVDSGEVRCIGYSDSTGGRRAKCYKLNENYESILTIFIQAGKYHVSILNMNGKTIEDAIYDHGDSDWTQELYQVIDKGFAMAGAQKVSSIGIAVPGTVHSGEISNIPTVPQWEGFDMKSDLFNRYGIPIVIENDTNAATIGIHNEANAHNMLFLHMKKGIGAGVVIQDKLYKGRHNFAGELAYMKITADQSSDATLEMVVSELAKRGDIQAVIEIVAQLLINVTCVIEPDLVVIDSSYLSKDDDVNIKQAVSRRIANEYIPKIVVRPVEDALYIKGIFVLCMNKTQNSVQLYY
ncbi:ROK family transcriptional regulator [Oscillospiraceae bacterium PP1C4]